MNIFLFITIFLCFIFKDYIKIFLFAFFCGLLNDIVSVNVIGVSSLFFLVTVFLIYLYQRKFSPYHLLFQLPFVLISDYLFKIITFKQWYFKNFIFLVGLSLIIFLLLNRIKTKRLGLELDV